MASHGTFFTVLREDKNNLKKGYIEMVDLYLLETLKSVLASSIIYYYYLIHLISLMLLFMLLSAP